MIKKEQPVLGCSFVVFFWPGRLGFVEHKISSPRTDMNSLGLA